MTDDTPALRALEGSGLDYEVIRTERASSAEESAAFQGIELRQLLRTIVLRRGDNDYLFVLVPGGRTIDWPKLRAHLGVSRSRCPTRTKPRPRRATNAEPSPPSDLTRSGPRSSTDR